MAGGVLAPVRRTFPTRVRRAVMTRALGSGLTAPLATRWSRGVRSYATYGEDLVLRQIFEHVPPGVYVEVGAFHPVDGSLFARRQAGE